MTQNLVYNGPSMFNFILKKIMILEENYEIKKNTIQMVAIKIQI